MSDAMRLQRTIYAALKELLPEYQEDNLYTLSLMIVGLLRGKSGQLAKIAREVCYQLGKQTSLVERFRRFVRNRNVVVEASYSPFAALILAAVQSETVTLLVDSTQIGSCIALTVSVYYKGRGLPLAWVTYKGKKGHSSQAVQLALFTFVQSLLPADKAVVLLGDGEFDGAEVLNWFLTEAHWAFVCRIDRTTLVEYEGEWIALQDLPLEVAQEILLLNLRCVKSNPVESLNLMIVWHQECQEHWFFATTFDTLATARKWYTKRFTTETLYSDWKSRGFNLHETRLLDPERVHRLLMAGSMAYVFTVMLGVSSILSRAYEDLVRLDVMFYSLFQLGLIFLAHLLNHSLDFPPLTALPSPDSFFFSSG